MITYLTFSFNSRRAKINPRRAADTPKIEACNLDLKYRQEKAVDIMDEEPWRHDTEDTDVKDYTGIRVNPWRTSWGLGNEDRLYRWRRK
jgi:hypothetical protein